MKNNSTVNNRILHGFLAMGVLFLALVVSLSWFELHGKLGIMSNSYNKRLTAAEDKTHRGAFLDAKGITLAYTESEKRIYPYDLLYTHLIGYNSKAYGKTLLESSYNDVLLASDNLSGTSGLADLVNKTNALINGQKPLGNDIHLTIDHELSKKCLALLGKKQGAIVALNPKTGAILAMVSTPSFNPNHTALEAQWADLTKRSDSPFLPRATMGLYPPGSTFKLITAAAQIDSGYSDYTLKDKGSIVIDGKTFANANNKSLGETDLKRAITYSSNVYFTSLSQTLGAKAILEKATAAGLGEGAPPLDFDIPMSKSRTGTSKDPKETLSPTDLAATAIGQGDLMVSPLTMAMITGGIANGGTIMKPYLIDHISAPPPFSKDFAATKPKTYSTFTTPQTAATLTDMMVACVAKGTGKKAAVRGIQVAGKTGTAQNEKPGHDHAWFVGFAPADDPQIALAIVLEYEGDSGGQAAAPLAAAIIKAALK